MKSPQELIFEIIGAGMKQRDIVAETGISKAFVSEMFKGGSKEPSYMIMAKLSEYHKKVMTKKRRQDKKNEFLEGIDV